jgi:hypothetical protein
MRTSRDHRKTRRREDSDHTFASSRLPVWFRATSTALVFAFTLIPAVALAQPAAPTESQCRACHRQQREPRLRAPVDELPGSVHGAHAVDCAACHGGRPDEPTVRAHDTAAGFRARVASAAEPAVCGDCHASVQHGATPAVDAGLDPLTLYQGSVHGKARAAGNARAATCAACHGAHAIRPARDPASPVSRERVAQTCARCHADAALTASAGLPHDQYAQWQRSVHGLAFARSEAEVRNVPGVPAGTLPPTCNDCHDDHAVRERDHAVSGCRGCHQAQWEAFSASPHAKAFERMGFLPCVDCHGSHEVGRADASLIGLDAGASCRRCHAEGQPQVAKIGALAGRVGAAQTKARSARQGTAGMAVTKAANVLGALDAAEASLGVAVHSLDAQRIGAAASLLEARAAAVPPAPVESNAWLGVPRGNLAMVGVLAVLGVAVLLLALVGGRRGKP